MTPRLATSLLVAATVLLGTAACAPKRVDWVKPGADQDRDSMIEAECRSLARDKIERNYRLGELTEREHDVTGDSVLRQRLDRYDARKDINRLFENCMRQHGYRPVEREESK